MQLLNRLHDLGGRCRLVPNRGACANSRLGSQRMLPAAGLQLKSSASAGACGIWIPEGSHIDSIDLDTYTCMYIDIDIDIDIEM